MIVKLGAGVKGVYRWGWGDLQSREASAQPRWLRIGRHPYEIHQATV